MKGQITMLNIIANIAGIIGFVLSTINFTYFFIIRRKKLSIRFDKISIKDSDNDLSCAKVKFTVENKSQLPISLTRIQLLANDTLYDCELLPQVAEELVRKNNNNGKIFDRYSLKTVHTPINLPALSAFSGYFAFLIPQGSLSNSDKHLTFRICTNRGKAVQKTYELSQDGRLL